MNSKPLILISNDDGITAPGLRNLIEIIKPIGDVVVVAPDGPQSGMGHAVTVDATLSINREKIDPNIIAYSCSGTPADCVKFALNEILVRKPDLCVSGINHGSNASINVIYSGTMSAAIEAGIEGIPAIGFSLTNYSWEADFNHLKYHVALIINQTLSQGLPPGVVLNVNIPKDEIKGIKICKQAKGYWKEQFDKRSNPMGKEYYWLSGEFVSQEKTSDTDIWALENNYISIVPTQFDLTHYKTITELNKWNLNE